MGPGEVVENVTLGQFADPEGPLIGFFKPSDREAAPVRHIPQGELAIVGMNFGTGPGRVDVEGPQGEG